MEHIIGIVAAILTTASFFPQALKVITTQHTEGISTGMYIIFSSGVTCWLIYGLLLGNVAIILANAITLPLVLTILYIKIKHDGFN